MAYANVAQLRQAGARSQGAARGQPGGRADDMTNQLPLVAGVCNAYLLIKCRVWLSRCLTVCVFWRVWVCACVCV